MTGEEKYNEFLKKIADYSASHGLDLVPYNDGIDQIVNVSRFELTKFTSEELIEYSLSVNLHVEYLQTCYNKEQAVLDWASAAIWYIISPQMSQFGGQYSKWEEINPVLLLAEQGYETDTRKMKIGNGVDKYLDLPYFGETLETIDGFLVTPKIKLETKTKFLIRELLTQADANEYFVII